jgi:hypothetical protein
VRLWKKWLFGLKLSEPAGHWNNGSILRKDQDGGLENALI